ncbi:WD40 repeat domain-containing protein [Sedimenticola sp.]|uniref:WD40 repeat domain-containing protein n=1 Tax=Sedimenticola sp. TaxID=1940285 RepID=UPI003D0A61B9
MRSAVGLVVLLSLLLVGCAGLEPAQPPDLNIPQSHLFGVTQLSFDTTGKRIATAGYKGDLAIWSVPQGAALDRFNWHHSPVRGLVWIGQDQLLSGEEAGGIVITDVTRRLISKRLETADGLTALAYISRSRLIVAGYRDGLLRLFRYPDLLPVKQLDLGAEVIALATNHNGDKLAVSTDDKRVRIWDATFYQPVELTPPPRSALELRFSPDDRALAAGAWYHVFYWDLESGRLRVQETEHWGAVASLDYHPDGKRLISLGRHTDANLRLVTTADGKVLRRLQGHRLCGAAVRFSPDGRYVASGSDDESVRLYDLSKPYRPQRVGDSW